MRIAAAITNRTLILIQRVLDRFSASRSYPFVIGLMALGATLSMAIPVTSILLFAVLAKPQQWRRIWLWSCLGSALGGSLLVLVFHHLAWGQIYTAFPKFETSVSWLRVTRWVLDYGLIALTWITALPLPQTPALIMCGVTRLPVEGVFTAVLIGKLVKYGVVTWVVYHFPERFLQFRNGIAKKYPPKN